MIYLVGNIKKYLKKYEYHYTISELIIDLIKSNNNLPINIKNYFICENDKYRTHSINKTEYDEIKYIISSSNEIDFLCNIYKILTNSEKCYIFINMINDDNLFSENIHRQLNNILVEVISNYNFVSINLDKYMSDAKQIPSIKLEETHINKFMKLFYHNIIDTIDIGNNLIIEINETYNNYKNNN